MMAGGEEKAGGESCSFHRQRRDSRWKPRAAGWLDEGTRPAALLIPSPSRFGDPRRRYAPPADDESTSRREGYKKNMGRFSETRQPEGRRRARTFPCITRCQAHRRPAR